ncbi:polysaccharide biosynthesis tyrosine autokinase [Pseudonocardia sp. RS010]|uniref:polysaccharide biosynthesis tyrosine autokinase n=1 Tax=Pseudonocardia sp. RS010 TaxID=3385979 RepID=UPI0039A0CDB9
MTSPAQPAETAKRLLQPDRALNAIRSNWLTILSLALLGCISSIIASWLTPPKYQTSLTMYVSAQATETASAAYQGAQLSQQRVSSYVQLIKSPTVMQDVAQLSGLDLTPAELSKMVSASSAVDTVLINISVEGDRPEHVVAIANATGLAMSNLVGELEKPTTPNGVPAVAIRVVDAASLPSSPSSPSATTYVLAGSITGLILGLATAFVRNHYDDAILDADQAREILHAPLLGSISYDPGVEKQPIGAIKDDQSPRAEAYRHIRTNLQFIGIDKAPRTILITSSLSEEGKTTTTINLAVALGATGSRVLLIDADLRRPSVSRTLGIEDSVGLTSVLTHRTHVNAAIQNWSGRFEVLASGQLPPNPSELLASRQMSGLLSELRQRYDYILIDSPPLLPVTDAAALAPAVDGVVLVCRYRRTKAKDLRSAAHTLTGKSVTVLGVVLSMVPSNGPHAYSRYHSYYQRTSSSIDGNHRSSSKANNQR